MIDFDLLLWIAAMWNSHDETLPKEKPMRKISLAFIIILNFALISQGAEAGQTRRLDTATYLEMEDIGDPQISPDGGHILFVRRSVDKMNDRARSRLWIVDVKGNRLRELTSGQGADFSPVWSPDGKRIAFLSDRDGTVQVYVLRPDSHEVARLTHVEHPPVGLRWSPDGQTLAFGMYLPVTRSPLPVTLPGFPKGAKLAEPAKVVDRMIWAYDGRGDIPEGFMHLFTVDAKTGGTPRQITSGDYTYHDPRQFWSCDPQWGHDGRTMLFAAFLKPWDEVEMEINECEIYALDLESGEIKQLTERDGPDRGMRVSYDGRWIVYTGFDDRKYADGNISSLYLMDIQGNKKRLLAGSLPSSPADVTWAPDGSGVYYLMAERGLSNLYFASLDGDIRKITKGEHYLSSFTLADNGQAAAICSSPHRPGYLVTFSVGQPETLTTVVDVNSDVLKDVKLGEVEEMRFRSPDGLDLQGWLIKPAEFEEGKKYPLVLWIHGGPYAMYSVRWNWAWQNFAAEGYAVLYMNPRGSTGYGQDFVDGIKYTYPGKDYDDLMAGVDAAVARGFIDTENMFVCGGSGGGILTSYIVGQTDRFRAACAMRPIVNYISAAGTADDPTDKYSWFKQPHWVDPLDWYQRSPIASVGNVTTPLLLMTGELDLRTPMGQSEEFFRALKMQRKDTLLIRMPNEYHGWRRPSHQMLNQLYLRAWFEKYRTR
jgi:dipeptidyl aminopeptidase/acylaminoacyl peptidase